MSENTLKLLEDWVKSNYKVNATAYTAERSRGNFDDCFDDGYECGFSSATYEVGEILGMPLEKPLDPGEDIY